MTDQSTSHRTAPMAGMPADEAVRYRLMIEERNRALQTVDDLRAEIRKLDAAMSGVEVGDRIVSRDDTVVIETDRGDLVIRGGDLDTLADAIEQARGA